MNDMSAVIIAKSDQINADDLVAGPMIVTIAAVKITPGTEQPVQMSLEETSKFFRPCKTVSRVMVSLWGADANQYVGRSLRLFRDPNVTWAGVKVGGIRVDQASHIDGERSLVVKESQKVSKVHKIKPLVMQKAEPEAPPIERARAAIENAPDLDTLKRVWASKAMAPFREELQPVLDAQKSALQSAGSVESEPE